MKSTKGNQHAIEMHSLPSRAYSNGIYVDGPKLAENSVSSDSLFGSDTATVGSECPGYEPVIPTELPRRGYIAPAEGSVLPPYGFGHLPSPNILDTPPRYRAYEDMDYDLQPPPIRSRTTITWSIIRRLSVAKPERSFCQYFPFALETTFAEVESMLFLDIFILFSGVWILSLGVLGLNRCPPASEILSLTALIYGVSAIASSVALLCMQFHQRRTFCNMTVVMICRLFRVGMLFLCVAGMNRLYRDYPPEESDEFDLRYCQTWLYWSEAFVYLMYFACFVLTLVHGILFGLWYLC